MKKFFEEPVVEVVDFFVEKIMDDEDLVSEIETKVNETPWG